MVNNINHVLDLDSESTEVFKFDTSLLFRYSRLISENNNGLIDYRQSNVDDFLDGEKSVYQKDDYNNEFYNFLDNKIKKTECRFNLLKLFRPGEILNSVSSAAAKA